MIGLLIIVACVGVPAKCVALPAGVEQWQVFIGNLWNVRGVEYMDASHVHIRDTSDNGCTAETVGGWGQSFGVAELIGSRVAIPIEFVTTSMVLETYVDDVRVTANAVSGVNCQTACGLGDFDGDCDIDLADYSVFQMEFGQ